MEKARAPLDRQRNESVKPSTPGPQALRVGVVILAAGLSRRMGTGGAGAGGVGSDARGAGSKLLCRIGGRTLIGHVLHRVDQARAALTAALDPVVVVIGPGATALEAELAQYPQVITVVNHQTHQGMSTSLRAGLKALPAGLDGAFILLGDQPFFPPRVFAALLAAWRGGSASGRATLGPEARQDLPHEQDSLPREDILIVAPVYAGRRGHPVLFSSRLFPELMAAEGDQGGREVLVRHRDRTRLVPLDAPLAAWDVDTPADLERLREAYENLQQHENRPQKGEGRRDEGA